MVKWSYYPKNKKAPSHIEELVNAFAKNYDNITSDQHDLISNEVLRKLCLDFEVLGYSVEKSKKKDDKIRVPVLYGAQGIEVLSFEVDAYNEELKTVIEVEAGRAVTNYQFLKDFFQANMMLDVEYFCVAVRQKYKSKDDFKSVCDFFDALYSSNRLSIPLEGILVIGY